MLKKKVIVIGAGFSGISAATFLAKSGYDVTILEKNSTPGGRARQLKSEGFTFDMGPSWYWMPDVFERYFAKFDKSVNEYYDLVRLDPSYSIYFGKDQEMKVPASLNAFYELFEHYEPGSSANLKVFLKESEYKYKVSMSDFVFKPGNSILEFMDIRLIKSAFNMHMFQSISKYIRKYFKHPELIKLLEFPVLFLGATPARTPALYSMMNYADICLGTWFPSGGMYSVVKGMVSLAEELGVTFEYNCEVSGFTYQNQKITNVQAGDRQFKADIVVAGADYHHIEQQLLEPEYRMYSSTYWKKRVLAPSCILYYVGVKGKLRNIEHHTLFFDAPFDQHAKEIYEKPEWPQCPLFYTSCASKSDPDSAPEGCESMVFLIPVAPGLQESKDIMDTYFEMISTRFDELTGNSLRGNILFRKNYGYSNFVDDYHSFKGNAYGLANTINQTAFLKPKMVSKKVHNLFFTGQLTTPGPGVPPSLISGEVVSNEIMKFRSS